MVPGDYAEKMAIQSNVQMLINHAMIKWALQVEALDALLNCIPGVTSACCDPVLTAWVVIIHHSCSVRPVLSSPFNSLHTYTFVLSASVGGER